MEYKFINKITSPNDLKSLNNEQINVLCDEIRDKLITTVSVNGGHLAPNLGVVELTVALHKVFDSPKDTIIFDVGHQCYTHKILTGRYKDFDTIRKEGGISGFMKPAESPHDPIITGHSSNSISAAFGIAKAKTLNKDDSYTISVVGDGSMTGGMVFEALNNAGKGKDRLIIILNDNKMSISRNVGAFARYLSIIRTKASYHRFKARIQKVISLIPFIGIPLKNKISNSKIMLKNAIYHSNIFEGMGFEYLGPVDGHDINKLCSVMEIAKMQTRPVVIHTMTIKGKGYLYAQSKPGNYHGVPSFNIETGEFESGSKTFSDCFGELMVSAAEKDQSVLAVTAAMEQGTGLSGFRSKFPQRFFDVGIAEQHAVTFTAGLAKMGKKAVFSVYSSFLQRSFDQIIHDAAIGSVPIKLCIDRAGFVGEDGETHQGIFDVPMLSSVPNIEVYSPSNFKDMEFGFNKMINSETPFVLRYSKGAEPDFDGVYTAEDTDYWYNDKKSDTVFITYGFEFKSVLDAVIELEKEGKSVSVLKLNKIIPINFEAVEIAAKHKNVFFFEESIKSGGIAEKMGAELSVLGFSGSYHITAINSFVPQALVSSSRKYCRLDTESIIKTFKENS